MYQSHLAGVELFSYVNTFVGFMLHILYTENLGQQSTFPSLTYSAESSVDFSRREEGTQHAANYGGFLLV